MKLALLSAANSVHTVRWANGLLSRGVDVHLISLHEPSRELDARVKLYRLPSAAPAGYLLNAPSLIRALGRIQPDLLNAHFASGYGLLARGSGFKPCLLSVWGSDVYDFPAKSFLHRAVLRSNLRSATALASTSRCMARKTAETFDHPHVFITPFGVDTETFLPDRSNRDPGRLVIGTVKTLKKKYGVDTLILAFARVLKKAASSASLVLEITGDGEDRPMLQALANTLGISDRVVFHGAVDHGRVAGMLARLDIYVALSRLDSESFGVAILEASACGKPVVVSDADGPAEVTLDGVTGFVVPRDNPDRAAEVILRLVESAELREQMGAAGRKHVQDNYSWQHSLDVMLDGMRRTASLEPRRD